jgi:hypothetical protein
MMNAKTTGTSSQPTSTLHNKHHPELAIGIEMDWMLMVIFQRTMIIICNNMKINLTLLTSLWVHYSGVVARLIKKRRNDGYIWSQGGGKEGGQFVVSPKR